MCVLALAWELFQRSFVRHVCLIVTTISFYSSCPWRKGGKAVVSSPVVSLPISSKTKKVRRSPSQRVSLFFLTYNSPKERVPPQ